MLNAIIVGAGPAGLAVANTLQNAGFSVQLLERGAVADHVSQYPTFMQFFSTRDLLEIDGFPLTITEEKPTRQQYLNYLARFAHDRRLDVRTYTDVERIARSEDGTFQVTARPRGRDAEIISTRCVIVACGAFNNPRMLDVPGEELPKVTHHFKEAHPYVGKKTLVVGGRNSAIEVALHLWRSGSDVSLSYRRETLEGYGIKYWLLPDIQNRLMNDEIHDYTGTEAVRIGWDSVTLRKRKNGEEFSIENDFVVACTGFDPPADFLRQAGVEVEEGTNIPSHNERTLETNVPGLFVAGTIIAGNVSGHVFIENSRHHGGMILSRLKQSLKSTIRGK
ncbi:YpdA family putative bacillithiol disulfide reductase [Candidatus Sumerlaeota bacterium]|nr:YpdA family putative bacillithiol disulfide reductase [Candidatus Sumerlaeota bacterium]